MIQIKQGLTDRAAVRRALALPSQRSLDQHLGPGKVLLSGGDVGSALSPLPVEVVVLRSLRYLNDFFPPLKLPQPCAFFFEEPRKMFPVYYVD